MRRLGMLLAVTTGLAVACTDLNEVASPDEVLALSASPPVVPADGFSSTTVTARVSSRAEEGLRDVIFSTTRGSFVGSDPAFPQTVVASVDSDGRASAILRSTTQVGTAIVGAEIRDGSAVKVARSIEVRFDAVSPSDIVQVTLSTDRAPADGATATQVEARVRRDLPATRSEILFTTTAGSFGGIQPTQISRSLNTDNVAVASLISPRTPGVATVAATVDGLQNRATVVFEPALPDRVVVTVFGSLQVKATFASKITLDVQLQRFVGQVTPGTEVVFRAFDDSTGGGFGFFSGVTLSDANGNVRAEFTPGNTTERGEATIRVRVPGTEILGRVQIEIVDP